MKIKWSVRREIKVAIAVVAVSFLIAFSERKHETICKSIVIELRNTNDNYFMDEADIMNLVENSEQSIKGASFSNINMRSIEAKLKKDKHILDADLYSDLKGNLVVNVDLRRPIARIIRDDGPDAYVAEDGVIMGVSEKFSSRVILITGDYAKTLIEWGDLNKTEEGAQLLEMIYFINDDRFWKAQVSQLDVNRDGKIFIYPQITGQLVEFGKVEGFEGKFKKLMIFYKEILPQRGWTKYERVNVEFEGQVIAE